MKIIVGDNNVMVDLETMGDGANAAIVSIGAVRFNEEGITDKYYQIVDLQSCIDSGLVVTGSTIQWWLKQSDQAREEIAQRGIHLAAALQDFTTWLGDDVILWGNGASFDNVILASAYRAVSHRLPWKFWNDRCYRTVKNQFPEIKLDRTGTHHNAVDDAYSQAWHLIEMAQSVKPLAALDMGVADYE
jgi:hypothetical protein